jgi:hypothetical protein
MTTSPERQALRREILTDDQRARILAARWVNFTPDQVIHIAEAWNAGHSAREIAPVIGCGRQSVATLTGRLKQIGVNLRKADPQGRGPCVEPGRPRSETEAEEAEYMALRRKGFQTHQVAQRLNLTPRRRERLEGLYLAQTFVFGTDSSVPKFADHERYAAAVSRFGGFPALSERRNSAGQPVVCLPVIYPARAA